MGRVEPDHRTGMGGTVVASSRNGVARKLPSLWTDVEALARLALSDQVAERTLLESRSGGVPSIQGPFPPFEERGEFEVRWAESPARVVSGDYADHFPVSEKTMVLVMADVSGKGAPAALLKGVTRSVLRNLSSCSASPGDTLARVNRILVEAELGSMFVTVFLGWYDVASGTLRYADAGHPLPYLVEAGGRVRAFGDVTGPILGILDQVHYEESEERIGAGERLVLYTDGVTEARSPEGGFFGHSRLMRFLAKSGRSSAEDLCDLLLRSVDEFQGGRRQDDATLLVLHRKH
jgi:sigma-B regulation protein RsbU (phosphoserine phosphatase)